MAFIPAISNQFFMNLGHYFDKTAKQHIIGAINRIKWTLNIFFDQINVWISPHV